MLAGLCSEVAVRPEALFIDFGQPAARSEAKASRSIAKQYDVSYRVLELRGFTTASGELTARNAFLVHAALMSFRANSGLIALGIHAGTGYRDCSPAFVELMSRSLDFHTDGSIGLLTPLLTFSKFEVIRLAVATDVPMDLTHSCEAADHPCGECPSCKDRDEFVAGA